MIRKGLLDRAMAKLVTCFCFLAGSRRIWKRKAWRRPKRLMIQLAACYSSNAHDNAGFSFTNALQKRITNVTQ